MALFTKQAVEIDVSREGRGYLYWLLRYVPLFRVWFSGLLVRNRE